MKFPTDDDLFYCSSKCFALIFPTILLNVFKKQLMYKIILSLTILLACLGCGKEKESNSPKSGFIEINGTNHFYQTMGTGDSLVILHGGPGLSHQYLKSQLDSLLSSNFTLLYYDQRASGWSDGIKDTSKLTIQTFVEDLESLRKHFKLSKMNLLGHSFGGLLAMHYAITYPGKVNSMILVDTDAASYELRTPYQIKMINSRLSEQQEAFLDSLEKTIEFKNFDPQIYEAYYKTFLTSYFANPKDTAKLTLGFDSVSVPKIGITNGIVRSNLGEYDIHNQLAKIMGRTLIIQGNESVFSVEGARAIHKELPNSEIHIFENCGHFEYIEFPKKFQNLVFEFYFID